jgi:hypothetical protein
MTKRFKIAVALAALTAVVSASSATAKNPTSLCGKIWKYRC